VLEDDAGLAGETFFAGALVVLALAAAFALVTGVFPVTAFLAESRREAEVVFFVVVVVDLVAGCFTVFLVATFGLVVVLLEEVALDLVAGVALAVDDFEAAGFLAAVLVAAGFLAAVALLVVRVVDLVAAGLVTLVALDAADLALVAAAGLATFEAGLFSLVSDASVLPTFLEGSLTRPERPLGKTRVPLSAPVEIALLS